MQRLGKRVHANIANQLCVCVFLYIVGIGEHQKNDRINWLRHRVIICVWECMCVCVGMRVCVWVLVVQVVNITNNNIYKALQMPSSLIPTPSVSGCECRGWCVCVCVCDIDSMHVYAYMTEQVWLLPQRWLLESAWMTEAHQNHVLAQMAKRENHSLIPQCEAESNNTCFWEELERQRRNLQSVGQNEHGCEDDFWNLYIYIHTHTHTHTHYLSNLLLL